MQAFNTHRLTQSAGRADALRSRAWLGARLVGALALLAVGALHLQQYFELYSTIPTIGTLFVLNFLGASATLFGFMEPGYDPQAIMFSRASEVVTVVLLAGYGVARFVRKAAETW